MQFVYIFGLFVFFVLVLIDEPKNAISVALLNHQLLNTSETVVISMIRLLREVDYNKSDKTFYFNDAANVARNVFTIHEECLEHILYIIYLLYIY